MVSPFTLPPTGFGPGSQPDPDGELQYMTMPSGMRTYSAHIPDVDGAEKEEALTYLARLADAADAVAKGGPSVEFDASELSSGGRYGVADAMGQGEVSMRVHGVPALKVQESVFAGVWMIAGDGIDRIEVATCPKIALSRAHLPHRPAVGSLARKVPGVVNAQSILSEIVDKSLTWKPGDEAHVVNLSLLPHTPEDLDYLDEALGEGAVTILSRGYGNCRVTACAQNHVWRVQFFNSMDTLILDTFEVTELPEVALAAFEDLADSAYRIRDVMEAIR